MAVEVVFRALAEQDIEEIGDRIALDSQRAAALWIAEVRQRCASLGEFPERYPIHTGVIRRMVAGPYLIFYRIADADIPTLRRVIVIRVMHGAREIGDILDTGP